MVARVIVGHHKTTFVNTVLTVASGATPDLGVFNTDQFSRFTGMFSAVGSMTFRYRMGTASGTYIVSSTFAVNSGNSSFDVINYGLFTDFDFTAVVSAEPRILVTGEPIR